MATLNKNMMYSQLSGENEAELFRKVIPVISWFGFIGNPLFYFICSSMGFYDNLAIRLMVSALFLSLLFALRYDNYFREIYQEFVLFAALPLMFSFFYYANEQNQYWKLSMLFAGAAYGMLSGKAVSSFIMIPFSCVISFVLVNILFGTVSTESFYSSIPLILVSLAIAAVLVFVKKMMRVIIVMSIKISSDSKRLEILQRQEEYVSKNRQLRNDIYTGQRLKIVADLSDGISHEIQNTLLFIHSNAFELNKQCLASDRKKKFETVLKLTEDAIGSLHRFRDFTS